MWSAVFYPWGRREWILSSPMIQSVVIELYLFIWYFNRRDVIPLEFQMFLLCSRAKRSHLYFVYHQGLCNTGGSNPLCLRYIIVTRHILQYMCRWNLDKVSCVFLISIKFGLFVFTTLSKFYPDVLETHFIQMLSR